MYIILYEVLMNHTLFNNQIIEQLAFKKIIKLFRLQMMKK